MTKAKDQRSSPLRAAECARRSGITVRALRVYERYGLIAPKRSAQGWRVYDAGDLARLNAILALKRLGMTLSQIRQALTGKPAPPLRGVLRDQLATSRARKAATDKLIGLLELALSRLHGREDLSVSDLCALAVEPTEQPPAITRPPETQMDALKMKRYESSQWDFTLDIPERWNSFPPVSSNSPAEVIRFASHEHGNHLLIVFRHPRDPTQPMESRREQVQKHLASKGFDNFVSGSTTFGPRVLLTLDFDRPQGNATWSCRHYFIAEGTLAYTLGFGTTDKAGMFELFDRTAKTFQIVPK